MTQEEKQLILKDICARYPYKVHCRVFKLNGDIKENDDVLYGIVGDNVMTLKSDKEECLMYYQIKPYLRPMSSMTEEEREHLQTLHNIISDENYGDGFSPAAWEAILGFNNYCREHHLDNGGLITLGLALEATEGMYK